MSRQRFLVSLRDQKGPITSLAFSPSGKYLASGGISQLTIWDLEKRRVLETSPQSYYERSEISTICWVTRTKEGFDILSYGNAKGFLVFLIHRPSQDRFDVLHAARVALGGEITCIAVKAESSNVEISRIALGTRDKCIMVFTFNPTTKELVPIHSITYGDGQGTIPKAMAFDNNTRADLYVFGLYDGGLYRYDGKDMSEISKHQLGSQIGNAVIDIERKICVIDNVRNGFSVYQVDLGSFVRDLTTRDAKHTFPKQVALGNDSGLVIGGSDHGLIYIFERDTGKCLKAFKHGRMRGVETIASHDNNNGTITIASASSSVSVNDQQALHIWQWNTNKTDYRGWSLKEVFEFFWKLTLIFLLAYGIRLLHISVSSGKELMYPSLRQNDGNTGEGHAQGTVKPSFVANTGGTADRAYMKDGDEYSEKLDDSEYESCQPQRTRHTRAERSVRDRNEQLEEDRNEKGNGHRFKEGQRSRKAASRVWNEEQDTDDANEDDDIELPEGRRQAIVNKDKAVGKSDNEETRNTNIPRKHMKKKSKKLEHPIRDEDFYESKDRRSGVAENIEKYTKDLMIRED
ncbi:hypothetical protein JR316_0009319 [Psilocybe cubensis]|uniref:Uncharacterized protein n=2 Tax=Psilocybe cubensis TaxID=181762 RepID=A0A8H7XVJ3_PSICU|nr:hypothetical protein JR316_0009319 [Psilocybe cubensis]KAH9478857.1 hypothetical protein JR316_0009319 [Psilocybe cubensis]